MGHNYRLHFCTTTVGLPQQRGRRHGLSICSCLHAVFGEWVNLKVKRECSHALLRVLYAELTDTLVIYSRIVGYTDCSTVQCI